MPLFCRHNRFESTCPICAKANAPVRSRAQAPARSTTSKTATRRPNRMVTKRLVRAIDDGYRNDLVPGLKATADAERLGAALTIAVEELDRREPLDLAQAAEAAFGDAGAIAGWTPPENASWTPERRFARWFDRLRLPGVTRAQRYSFLLMLGPAYDLEPGDLFFDVKGQDPATLAAKRALNSGDAMLLERRARAFADAAEVPIGALDRGLALWDGDEPLDAEPATPVRRALRF